MISYIKSFSSKISHEVKLVLIAVISVLYVVLNLMSRSGFLPILQILLPSILILYVIYLLVSKNALAHAHVVLFLLTFSNGIGTLIRSIFSYNFGLNVWSSPPTWQIILSAIICAYLLLMSLSFLLKGEVYFKFEQSIYIFPLLLILLYLYLANSMGTLIIVLIPILICLGAGAGFAALMLMLAQVISVPITLINLFVVGGASFTNIFYWLINCFALFLIYLLFRMAFQELKKKEVVKSN